MLWASQIAAAKADELLHWFTISRRNILVIRCWLRDRWILIINIPVLERKVKRKTNSNKSISWYVLKEIIYKMMHFFCIVSWENFLVMSFIEKLHDIFVNCPYSRIQSLNIQFLSKISELKPVSWENCFSNKNKYDFKTMRCVYTMWILKLNRIQSVRKNYRFVTILEV